MSVRRLNAQEADFIEALDAFIATDRDGGADVSGAVRDIIADVRTHGFSALAALTRKFDGVEISPETIRVPADDLDAAFNALDPELIADLQLAAARIEAFHQHQIPEDKRYTDDIGVTLGWRWTPVDAAGLYAPGGRALYPSSVLMNAIPAKVAGVSRLAMVTPASGGAVSPLVLAAARIAGVDEIYTIGGAQAIAALAYGCDPIAPVDVIVGPGNAYVAEAKRQVFGAVGIDSVAGPSEILVVADDANDPVWIAEDLLSQAEHDPSSQSVLVTDSTSFGDAVAKAVEAALQDHPRKEIAGAAWRKNSAIIVVRQLEDAAAIVNRLAPEHLELAVADPEALLPNVRHAGAIFLGRHAPEAIGDYLAGPDHVLPTARAARYASGLSVLDFMKRSSIISCSADALEKVGPAAARLADAENLPSHARSIRVRLGRKSGD